MVEHRRGLRQPRARALAGALERVVAEWRSSGVLSTQSLPRLVGLAERFCAFVERGFGIRGFAEASSEHVEAFVHAPTARRRSPEPGTLHLRRSAVRLLFRTARELALASGDPTLDLWLPPRSGSRARPLTDDEVALCRSASLHSLTSTRLSAAWALAEATARTAELAHLAIADLDTPASRVWIHGSPRTQPRWGVLSGWGVSQLRRRVDQLGAGASSATRLVYGGDGSAQSRQASSCQAISETLARAGLAGEPDLRPVSVAAWTGARVLRQTGRIDAAALALGIRSLDRTAELLAWDWHQDCDER